jgi:outer membrane protein TolC
MKSAILSALLALLVLLPAGCMLAGCMKVQRYHPAPLAPSATAASLEARSLANPALRPFLQRGLGQKLSTWPQQSWNLRMLMLAALYYNPALSQARARVSFAKAAVVTANERPNPTFHLQPGIPSPYLFALNLLFPIRTAGRRKIMVAQAQDLTLAARLSLAQTTWQVCSGVRAAVVSDLMATRKVRLLRAQEQLQAHRVLLLRQRLAAGEISRPMLASAQLALLQSRIAFEAARSRIPESRAALAAAIGVPDTALAGIHLVWPTFGHPPPAHSISPTQIQREAVLNRLDVRKALAQYAATQSALQLQIAKQHPDFQLGPGYDFEEGSNYFTLAYSVTLPIFNRNQGPIAQAQAQRKAAAAAFLATQAGAIAQSEEALARYRAAWRTLTGSEQALLQLSHQVIPKERSTVAAGQAGPLALNAVLLQKPGLALAWLTALGQTQSALGALEDSVQRPLQPDEILLRVTPNSAPHSAHSPMQKRTP